MKKFLKLICIAALLLQSVYAAANVDEKKYGKAFADNIVPGVIEAEDFNDGANGVAYYDGTESKASVYRRDTDVEIVNYGKNYMVAPYTGEWMNYTVNALAKGQYIISAFGYDGTGNGSGVTIYVNGKKILDKAPMNATVGNVLSEQELGVIELEKGSNVIRFEMSKGYGGYDFIRLVRKRNSNIGKPAYFARKVPCMIMSQNYDIGGENVSYRMTKSDIPVQSLRSDGVNYVGGKNGGYVLLKEHDWINYTVQNGDFTEYDILLTAQGKESDISILQDGKEVIRGNIDASEKAAVRIGTVSAKGEENTYSIKVNSGELKLYAIKFDVMNIGNKSEKFIRVWKTEEERKTALAPDAVGEIIYVSPDGNGDGTDGNPASLEKALSIFESRKGKMTGNAKIYLEDGIYAIGETIKFNEKLSGVNNYSLIFESRNKDGAVFSSLIQPGTWENTEENIWSVETAENVTGVIAGDKLKNIAESETINALSGFGNEITIGKKIEFANTKGLKAVWNIGQRYISIDIDNVRYEEENTVIVLNKEQFEKASAMVNKEYTPSYKKPFYIKNCDEALEAGQWRYDAETKRVYYRLASGEKIEDVKLCGDGETMFELSGAENITFKGIKFIGGNGISKAFASTEADLDVYSETKLNAAIKVQNCRNITFSGNSFVGFAASVVDIGENCSNISITENKFSDLGGSAVSVGITNIKTAGDLSRIPDSITISKNDIENVGVYFKSAPALMLYNSDNTFVEGNYIKGAAYAGIYVGQNYESAINVCNNLYIRDNILENTMTKLENGGALTLCGRYTNATIENNTLKGNGIYFGNYVSGYTIKNNIIDTAEFWINMWSSEVTDIAIIKNEVSGNSLLKGKNITVID